MDPAQCKHFELEIVDDLLGNLPVIRRKALQYHLAECVPCRKAYEEWRQILNENISAAPSARLYRRLKNAFLFRQIKRRLLRPSLLRGAVAVAVMLLIGIAASQGKMPLYSWEQLPPVTARDIPLFVINDPKTVQYPIILQEGQLTGISGIIWVNRHRDEIYCYVYGLENNAGYDYQIWLIKAVQREDGGLLRITGKYGELYLRQRNIHEVLQISISLEPEGGSLYPTAEDTILVNFNSPAHAK
ncbi:MAG: anti-sigma factor [Bacillota bacterium]